MTEYIAGVATGLFVGVCVSYVCALLWLMKNGPRI